MSHCDAGCIVPIASTACQFMEEMGLSSVTRESSHNYPNNYSSEEKVEIVGATSLSVRFDARSEISTRLLSDYETL